ncbi:MAG TPA: hypothetical protein DCY06_05385 [Bacteroidetes bacterium]|nr:septum formation initiator family protein [Ignavibacteriaceae bacterium]HAY33548.1 hypothetical protein [Bacteroidota bacterium]HRI47564.1 septum formation initiator family protein [Ignavibacteriaceae bacterium]
MVDKSKKIFLVVYLATIILFIVYMTFSEFGFIKYLGLKSEIEQLERDIKFNEDQNNRLKAEIDSLKQKVKHKIEKTAREKYGMSLPNESIIKVEIK